MSQTYNIDFIGNGIDLLHYDPFGNAPGASTPTKQRVIDFQTLQTLTLAAGDVNATYNFGVVPNCMSPDDTPDQHTMAVSTEVECQYDHLSYCRDILGWGAGFGGATFGFSRSSTSLAARSTTECAKWNIAYRFFAFVGLQFLIERSIYTSDAKTPNPDTPLPLDQYFSADVASLCSGTLSTEQFIATYGTHYPASLALGGLIIRGKELTESDCVKLGATSVDTSTAAVSELAFAVGARGSTTDSNLQGYQNVTGTTFTVMYQMGGIDDSMLQTWEDQVTTSPAMVKFVPAKLSDLLIPRFFPGIDAATLATASAGLSQAIDTYMTSSCDPPSIAVRTKYPDTVIWDSGDKHGIKRMQVFAPAQNSISPYLYAGQLASTDGVTGMVPVLMDVSPNQDALLRNDPVNPLNNNFIWTDTSSRVPSHAYLIRFSDPTGAYKSLGDYFVPGDVSNASIAAMEANVALLRADFTVAGAKSQPYWTDAHTHGDIDLTLYAIDEVPGTNPKPTETNFFRGNPTGGYAAYDDYVLIAAQARFAPQILAQAMPPVDAATEVVRLAELRELCKEA